MAKKVLLIDDDAALLASLAEALADAGYETAAAEDGIAGLQKAQTWRPDVIVMDFQMPGGTGDQVFLRLRTLTQTVKTPIVFISGIPAEEAQKKIPTGFKTAYLRKPCRVDDLLRAISSLLR